MQLLSNWHQIFTPSSSSSIAILNSFLDRLDTGLTDKTYSGKNIWHDTVMSILDYFYDNLNFTIKQEKDDGVQSIIKVTCFTKHRNNLVMWSHYANEYQGFCVEYDLSAVLNRTRQGNFEGLTKLQKHSIMSLFPVFYTMNRNDMTISMLDNFYGENKSFTADLFKYGVCSKSIRWCYEDEWRLAVERHITDDNFMDFFPKSAVYLGCKMPSEKKEEIYNLLSTTKIDIFDSNMSNTQYDLEFSPYIPRKKHDSIYLP